MVKKTEEGKINFHRCPVVYALEIIGGKWVLPIIWELSGKECLRYNELKRRLDGITNIMLTRTLKKLERHNLVTRIERNQIPPHVEYSLTESCKRLHPALAIINQWGEELMLNSSDDKKEE
jgi:DNA-binding HxlR family transcriptional regulator